MGHKVRKIEDDNDSYVYCIVCTLCVPYELRSEWYVHFTHIYLQVHLIIKHLLSEGFYDYFNALYVREIHLGT